MTTRAFSSTNTALLDLAEEPVSWTVQAATTLCTTLGAPSCGRVERPPLPVPAPLSPVEEKSPEDERYLVSTGPALTGAGTLPLETYEACTMAVKQAMTSRRTFSSLSLKRRTSCGPQTA